MPEINHQSYREYLVNVMREINEKEKHYSSVNIDLPSTHLATSFMKICCSLLKNAQHFFANVVSLLLFPPLRDSVL